MILLLQLIFTSAVENIVEEDPDCPCLGIHAHNNTPKTGNGTCLDARIVTNSSGIPSTHCFPLEYGMTCATHDVNRGPFCNGKNRPEFCGEPFCYVDHEKCKLSGKSSFVQSKFFPHLYFSYSTCGATDMFEEFFAVNSLSGQTLRVGVPAIYFPYHYKLDENGKPIPFDLNTSKGVGEWTGIYIDFLWEIANLANFEIEFHSISPGAIKQSNGETWSACVIDVGRGLLDLCVSNFWETSERRKIASFTSTIFNDFFKVVVPLPKIDKSIQVEMGKLFQPFTTGLWITICMCTLFVGISYTLLASNRKSSIRDILKNLWGSIYDATFELLQGTDSSDRSPALKLVSLSWAFFILIIIAAYTANLAAFLSREELIFRVTDIHDCIDKGCKMCSLQSGVLKTTFMRKFPKLQLDLKFAGVRELNVGLSSGRCDALIASEFDWFLERNAFKDCQTTFIGEHAIFFKVGWPIVERYQKSFSYWLGKTSEIGEFKTLDIVGKYRPHNTCPDPFNRLEREQLASQITVASMTGPLVILLAGMIGGFALRFAKCIRKKSNNRRRMGQVRRDKRRQVKLMIADSDLQLPEKPPDTHEE